MDYNKLLEKAYSEVKEVKGSSERFEISLKSAQY